jgi:hypothetical protein
MSETLLLPGAVEWWFDAATVLSSLGKDHLFPSHISYGRTSVG